MKYLKIFEIFTSDKFEEQIEDLFIGITDDLGAGIQVVRDQFNTGPRTERLQVKILLPHGYEHSPMDVYYKIKDELQPIHNKIMKDYELKFSGCSQLKRREDPNYHGVVSLVYYKYETAETKVNKYLKQFEGFGQFQLDEISKEEYYSIFNNNRLVYIPESKVLEFKTKLSKEYKLVYARASVKDTVEWFRAEYETEIDYHFTCKRFSIKKLSQGADEPCYIMSYNYEEFTSFEAPKSHIETLPDQKRISFQKQSYYRFEESDFNQMCENPQILLDYLEKDIIKESFEYEGEPHIKEICKGWGVEIEDLEDLFIEFADDDGKVLFSYMLGPLQGGIIQITIRDIWKDLNDGDWLYNPLWDERFNSIKRKLNRFGLDMNVIVKSLNHGRYANVRIFPITDKKRTHSKTDIVTESFEIGMAAHNIVNDFGLVMEDIEDLFIDFSDMGYKVRIMKRSLAVGEKPGLLFPKLGHDILIVDIIGIGDKSNDPDIRLLKEKIIRKSKLLGLDMVDTPKWVTQFMQKSDLRFKFNKL